MRDAVRLKQLYRKYVGSGSVDVERLYDVVCREARSAEKGVVRVTRDLLRELRAERAEVGSLMGRVR